MAQNGFCSCLLRYDGAQPYVPIFEFAAPKNLGKCFPAGHASAGYSLVSLYFLAKHSAWPSPHIWLLGALFLGLILDIDQQLRGAHFLSHGLWTLIIAWATTLLMFAWYGAGSRRAKAPPSLDG